MDAGLATLQEPYRIRKLRYFLSSGRARDTHGISLKQKRTMRLWLKLAKFQTNLASISGNAEDLDIAVDMVKLFAISFCKREETIPRPRRLRFTIMVTLPEFTGELYRFRTRADLFRIFNLFQIPDRCGPFQNGAFESGEKLFLFFVRRLASVGTLTSLIQTFGGEKTKWSRGVFWLAQWIYVKWGHITSGIRPAAVARFQKYAKAVERVANEGGCGFVPGTCSVGFFIDCNQIVSTRTGSGPATHGRGAPRKDPTGEIQMALYNGWKSTNGAKSQSLDYPDGIMGYLYGLESIRRSDLNCLEWSDINEKVKVAQDQAGIPPANHVIAYGDSIYPQCSHLHSKTGDAAMDAGMNSARQAIEHHYGECAMYFPFLSYKKKVKIGSSMPLEALYFCMHLFRNVYTCLYGNKTSVRFNCEPPTPEEYMAW
mmetsp:Transcript_29832/g.60982  ORF Transcript_29832/g.60982 Transcript_29832/m.60982 type:complete len:427 (-) Transcript_29832:203-1483(-)|eukprot:CAMPEP_0171639424 /NCGR_PEP_ID=MMETSP0990-20121206/29722_1 /TAXON_ID=483369 /ORGANISM="non described non described, Strain CCMP2098" /LENGTH=426 /DNA_ID=CAMNT_0012213193 /DNA_START=56 /DNA_END=1336 /DNA_ORIENTATION=-